MHKYYILNRETGELIGPMVFKTASKKKQELESLGYEVVVLMVVVDENGEVTRR